MKGARSGGESRIYTEWEAAVEVWAVVAAASAEVARAESGGPTQIDESGFIASAVNADAP